MDPGQGYVDIWRADLDADEASLIEYRKILSPEEIQRADRLKIEESRRQFITARGALRGILSLYADTPPETLHFRYNENGKPEIFEPASAREIHFNLSHSGGCALVAVTRENLIGIDIEHIRHNLDYMKLAKRYFLQEENEELLGISDSDRREAFYRIWTRKEAYIKGKGAGLWQLIDKIRTTGTSGGSVKLSLNLKHPGDIDRWHIRDLDRAFTGVDFSAAVALENAVPEIRYRVWKSEVRGQRSD